MLILRQIMLLFFAAGAYGLDRNIEGAILLAACVIVGAISDLKP